jgi:WD40 repeat protein
LFILRQGSKLLALKQDARISEQLYSVSTIYTSGLPFSSNSSSLVPHYNSRPSVHSQWNGQNLLGGKKYAHCISPDGTRVATSTENILSVSSSTGGSLIWSKKTAIWAGKPVFSPDGQILGCYKIGVIQLLDAISGNVIKPNIQVGNEHEIWHAAISPQNDCIAVVLEIMTGATKTCIFRLEDGTMTWESDESTTFRVLYLSDGRLANVYTDERVVNGQTGDSLDGLTFDKSIVGEDIYCMSVSPDASLLAIGPWVGHHHSFSIWTTASGQLVTTLKGHKHTITSTSFSSDGSMLVSGSTDQTVRVWKCCPQTETWSCVAVLYGHSQYVESVAFLPDSKGVMSAGGDGTIRIWDISAVLEGKEFKVHPDQGALVVDGWFQHGICLGGWRYGEPFLFQYPFKLPEGVQSLDWHIQSETEEGGNDKDEQASSSDGV